MKLNDIPHRRKNILTGEWVQVSPHRTKRPWQGKTENTQNNKGIDYDPGCYLCPGNKRASGEVNPNYSDQFVFVNDYSPLIPIEKNVNENINDLLIANSEEGICKVICFSPKHNLTLPEMEIEDIENVIKVWKQQYEELGSKEEINYVQIFENKGELMGCSNPHPHGQIWAQNSIPSEPAKETISFENYFEINGVSVLSDYLALELELKERLVYENQAFVVLVPYWATWPYETMIIPRKQLKSLLEFNNEIIYSFADAIKVLTIKYDNLFNVSFPYSAGIHQMPTDNREYNGWHLHMHFYPPLLRSATIKKFMVGYEMLANPQRDITPERAAEILKSLSKIHYSIKN